ncbi:recombinase family protein, partial [Bradyrhizobium canariense]
MAKAYSYIRMSTEAQLKGDSLRRQLELSRRYAAARNLELHESFSPPDIGVSAYKGANVSTGSLGKFLQAVETGQIEQGSYLLVESLDRLSRQEVLKSLALFLQIINSGIVLVTLADERIFRRESMNEADLFISIGVMSRAHEESRTKSTRISHAWENKRRQAKQRKLTAMAPSWLKLNADRTDFYILEDRAEIVRRIFQEAASGVGIFTIARRLNLSRVPPFGRSNGWHTSSVNKILTHRAVLGFFQPHRVINGVRTPAGDPIEAYYPAIVPEDLFYAAQAGLEQRRFSGAGRKGETISNLFGRLAACAYCGSRMHYENKGRGPKGGAYLICEAGFRRHNCKPARWRYSSFEASFLAFVQELDLQSVLASDDQANQRNALSKKKEALLGRLSELSRQRENIFSLTKRADFKYAYDEGRLIDTCARARRVLRWRCVKVRRLADRRTCRLGAGAS